jgi:hypothetical protein
VTDLRTALARVAGPDGAGPDGAGPDPHVVDSDVVRGRRALRRRRTARGAGALVLVTAAAGVVRAAGPADEPSRTVAPPPATLVEPSAAPSSLPASTPPATRAPGVKLVAFTGRQPSGYTVEYVPSGWEIQGANAFALVIAPKGFPDQHPDSFEGKIVVMLRSRDDTGEPVGTPVKVGTGTGYVNRAEESFATVLTYRDTRGNWVQVQVPPSLRWNDQQVARFGEGVTVTRHAEPGRG